MLGDPIISNGCVVPLPSLKSVPSNIPNPGYTLAVDSVGILGLGRIYMIIYHNTQIYYDLLYGINVRLVGVDSHSEFRNNANSPIVNPYLGGNPKLLPNFLPIMPASISLRQPSTLLPNGLGTSTTIN